MTNKIRGYKWNLTEGETWIVVLVNLPKLTVRP